MNLDLLNWTLVVLLGLAIGSFLNVVIHRLPRMMAAQWAAEVAAEAQPQKLSRPCRKTATTSRSPARIARTAAMHCRGTRTCP